MRRIHLIPNIITAFGLACGLFVIFKLNMFEPGAEMFHVLNTSVLLLLVAAFADLLDGAVARAMRAESEFGFFFDALADAISFGVAPSVLLLKALSLDPGTGLSFFALLGVMLFSICGVLRLVRFNVKATEAKGNEEAIAAQKKHFTGLPIRCSTDGICYNTVFCFPFCGDISPYGSADQRDHLDGDDGHSWIFYGQ